MTKNNNKTCVTYLQNDSPSDFCRHFPLFLHGDGEHDKNPKIEKEKEKKMISKNLF